ncbi:hypothetical protein M3I53_02730 [Paraburkholderia sp. CNPSo 3272]|uniref:hypothetical protein n=1 Tax=Paraburkholderia sp. CNPSo 3272 TaxID=2940931 RepID=UPI0020B74BE5|nr:hypothetical protein [Paraburkholderia sp. CNPSo 3272]MCP3722050.1 hypothetical protein [Paraburkholderia sp. CNPSo 3272]
MSSSHRHQLGPYVFAAALQAACAAWPCAVFAQAATYGAATGGSPAAASAQSSQSGRDDAPANAVQRQQLDEQRLLGGPGTSDNPYSVTPYSSNGASPDDARDALTNEKHMHVVPPGDYAASAASANGGRGDRSSSASSAGGRGAANHSRIGANGMSRAGNAVARSTGGSGAGSKRSAAGYDYGASQTSPTAQVYGNPYGSPYGSPDQSNSELYKSPW